jgi:guanylate kinase
MLVALTGCSQSGRGTLMPLLLKDKRFIKVKTATSRPKRVNEPDTRYFVDISEFDDKDKFIEQEKVHGNYYGIYKKEIEEKISSDKIALIDIDPKGAYKLKTSLKKLIPSKVLIIFLHPGKEITIQRIKDKKDKDMEQRLNDIDSELSLLDKDVVDYVIDTSTSIEESLKLLIEIMIKENDNIIF